MAQYRIIYYVPDPFLGGGVPIAAVVEHETMREMHRNVNVTVVPIPHSILDRRTTAFTLIQLVLRDLQERMVDFDRLPASVGPQVNMGESQPIPEGSDPVLWIEDRVA